MGDCNQAPRDEEVETVDKMTNRQIAARVRQHFQRDRGSDRPAGQSQSEPVGPACPDIGATGTLEPEEAVEIGTQVAEHILAFGTDRHGRPVDCGSEDHAVRATPHCDGVGVSLEAAYILWQRWSDRGKEADDEYH